MIYVRFVRGISSQMEIEVMDIQLLVGKKLADTKKGNKHYSATHPKNKDVEFDLYAVNDLEVGSTVNCSCIAIDGILDNGKFHGAAFKGAR